MRSHSFEAFLFERRPVLYNFCAVLIEISFGTLQGRTMGVQTQESNGTRDENPLIYHLRIPWVAVVPRFFGEHRRWMADSSGSANSRIEWYHLLMSRGERMGEWFLKKFTLRRKGMKSWDLCSFLGDQKTVRIEEWSKIEDLHLTLIQTQERMEPTLTLTCEWKKHEKSERRASPIQSGYV